VIRYFTRALFAQVRSTLALYLLTILGVGVGVAAVVAIQLINRNAVGAFEAGIDAATGPADIIIEGATPSFPEATLAPALQTVGVRDARPVFQAEAILDGPQAVRVEILGIDLSRGVPLSQSQAVDLESALATPGWCLASQTLAERVDASPGDRLDLSVGSRAAALLVGSLLDLRRLGPSSGRALLILDISQAQSLFGRRGEVHRIEIETQPGSDLRTVERRLRAALPAGFQVLTPGERRERARALLGAFRLNLTALSLISLFVGLFIVYSSTQASLVRRRREFGLLRSLGATPGQVLGLILGEVSLLGVLGVAVGIPLGYWAAESSMASVNSTLTNIYLLGRVEHLQFDRWIWVVAVGIGLASALAGAVLPALDMSRRDTRSLLAAFSIRDRLFSSAPALLKGAIAILTSAGVVVLLTGSSWKPGGFILGIAVLVALPMSAPWLLVTLAGRVTINDFGFRFALRTLADRIHNTVFPISALAIAVSMLVGITLMIGSFRETVKVWIETTVVADLYATARSWRGAGSEGGFDDATVRLFAAQKGVAAVDRIRTVPVYLDGTRILVSGVDLHSSESRHRYPLLHGDPGRAFGELEGGNAVLISEPLARKRSLGVGDTLVLPGASGPREMRIAGVFYDYTSEWGLAVIRFDKMTAILGPGPPHSLALYLDPRANPDVVRSSLEETFEDEPVRIISNSQLRKGVLDIFDQTFAVVRLLQLMSLLIAACGITLTLLILARERVSELALYRALGAERRQVFRVFLAKGGGIAVVSSVLGVLGGTALALILILLINRAYFGWTIQLSVPWVDLAASLLLIFAAAFAASIYPSLRASRTPVTELSREDL